ncbi:hypothetical protein [Parasitella parasitica]|uniref:RRM domain-containing protein n=1 Tax=Parasitella parasitica TaxID=35722 RepID=A0A0B7NCY0_9FUNG|nr:hypothetical protein [Parasitella parasitica]
MKRSNDSQQQSYQDDNKKPRYSTQGYNDMYAQYGMIPQYGQANPFAPGAASSAAYGGFAQPNAAMYAMGYGNPQSMMTGQYGGAYPQSFNAGTVAYAAAGASAGNMMSTEPSRTIYLGNVNKDVDPHDILKCVHTGNVDSFRAVPEKNCAFLTFVEPASAQMFYQEFLTKKLIVGETEIKVGWGKPNTMPHAKKLQIQSGATRNVYLGRLTEADTEDSIRSAVSAFGPIEQIRLLREKNIAFIHFLSITSATKCITTLSADPAWRDKKVNYGKDQCSDMAEQFNAVGTYGNPYGAVGGFGGFDPYGMNAGYAMQASTGSIQRTLYFGNVHPEATCEDLCNVIRGGALLQIRLISEKHIAFVSFMDAETAMAVFNHAATTGLVIKGRKIRVGWGKPSTIPPQVAIAFQNGATRNIYIGGIDDKFSIEKLRTDFSEFGEVELVNVFKEKNCAFVNFTSIANAMNALKGIKAKPDYASVKINYGKDRCSNPWRMMKRKVVGNATTGTKKLESEEHDDSKNLESCAIKTEQ